MEAVGTVNLVMPAIPGFRVARSFRLFISTRPIDELPLSFLQSANLIVLEPAKSIRLNIIKSLNSTTVEYMTACGELQVPFRQLFFVLTFYHAVMSDRNKFGSLGWSRPYQFMQADHRIGALQLLSLCRDCRGDKSKVPMRLLNYLVTRINYGGRVGSEQDGAVAEELLRGLITTETATGRPYDLLGEPNPFEVATGHGTYMMPPPGDLDRYVRYVTGTYPLQDRPEIFGVHPNAQLTLAE